MLSVFIIITPSQVSTQWHFLYLVPSLFSVRSEVLRTTNEPAAAKTFISWKMKVYFALPCVLLLLSSESSLLVDLNSPEYLMYFISTNIVLISYLPLSRSKCS